MDVTFQLADGTVFSEHVIPLDLSRMQKITGRRIPMTIAEADVDDALILGWVVATRVGHTTEPSWEKWAETVYELGVPDRPLDSGKSDAPTSPPVPASPGGS